jgi:hypothetical protein
MRVYYYARVHKKELPFQDLRVEQLLSEYHCSLFCDHYLFVASDRVWLHARAESHHLVFYHHI